MKYFSMIESGVKKMDEEKKIMEKRSSFRGWKERNKGKMNQKRNIIVVAIVISTLFALATYPYWNKISDDQSPVKQPNKTSKQTPVKNVTKNYSKSSNDSSPKIVNTPSVTSTPKRSIIGEIGVPIVSNYLEITIKRASPSMLHTDIWASIRNIDDHEKPLKIGPGTVVIDNIGQQYENIKVARSAEISQANLSSQAMREGAIFFERLKDGRTLKKLILNINNEKIEFMLGQ